MNLQDSTTDSARNPDGNDQLRELGYTPELRRTMSLLDVVVFGLIYMVPLAPVAIFGVVYNFSEGMPVLVYLVAAVAMFFSAVSYKEMAKRYPIAGSVYSYVRKGLNPFVGFLTGWAILLDYLLLPALLAVFAAAAMSSLLPAIPIVVWVIAFVIAAAGVVLRGVTLTAGINKLFLIIQLAVLAIFSVGAVIAVAQGRGAFSTDAIFRSEGFSWEIVFGAIPIAALSYVGFDAISTLNEEARGGGRAVSKATMIVLAAVTFLFVVQVYLAAIFVPTGTVFADGDPVNNAFYNIAGTVVGPWFRTVLVLTSALIAIFANSIASQATSSRLLFSMARDGQLPKLLAKIDQKRQVPQNAILLIAVLSLIVGIIGAESLGLLTTLVTFGALTAYILLHISVFVHLGVRNAGGGRNIFNHLVSPVIGAVVLVYALWNANYHAKILGCIWLVVGVGIALLAEARGRRLELSEPAEVKGPAGF